VWNGLPSEVTSASSLSVFKNRLKTYLFRRCYETVWLSITFPFPSHYLPPQNSGPRNSFYCLGHSKNVYDDDDNRHVSPHMQNKNAYLTHFENANKFKKTPCAPHLYTAVIYQLLGDKLHKGFKNTMNTAHTGTYTYRLVIWKNKYTLRVFVSVIPLKDWKLRLLSDVQLVARSTRKAC